MFEAYAGGANNPKLWVSGTYDSCAERSVLYHEVQEFIADYKVFFDTRTNHAHLLQAA